jgi:hypothetical protein
VQLVQGDAPRWAAAVTLDFTVAAVLFVQLAVAR